MRLYHFLKTYHAVDDVVKARIKLSLYEDSNDPFELLPFDLSDPLKRKALENLKTKLHEGYGMICLCKGWHSPLMWAHYAENHKGVALGFDVPEDYCEKIHYFPELLQIPAGGDPEYGRRRLADGRRVIDALLTTKFEGWQYEEEIRVFAQQDGTNTDQGLEFLPFSPKTLALREVILGARCPLSIAQFRAAALNIDPTVTIIKARRALHDFRFEQDPDAI